MYVCMSPAHSQHHMCNYPCIGTTTAEKIPEKSFEKFRVQFFMTEFEPVMSHVWKRLHMWFQHTLLTQHFQKRYCLCNQITWIAPLPHPATTLCALSEKLTLYIPITSPKSTLTDASLEAPLIEALKVQRLKIYKLKRTNYIWLLQCSQHCSHDIWHRQCVVSNFQRSCKFELTSVCRFIK